MKFGGIVLQVNMHRLTESDFCYIVIVSRWQAPNASLQFLIHSTFVLVTITF